MIVLCVIISSIIYIFLKFRRKPMCNLPGPKPLPIVGNAFEFLTKEPLEVIWRLQNKYGGSCRVWLATDLYVILTDPVDIEVILSSYKHILKAISYKYVTSWLGNGLITSFGETWYRHRKFLTPAFHFKILENSIEIIYKNTKILAQQLQAEDGKSEFDIHPYIEKCSLDIICEVSMNVKINAQTTEDSSYLHAIKRVTNTSTSRIFKLWLQPDILFRLFGNYNLYQKSLRIIETVSKNVISSKRKKIEESEKKLSGQVDTEIKKKLPIPFLDWILKESNFSDNEVYDEVMSFLFAGHDTTTSSICFCIYQLANYPDVQEKVYNEIMEMLPKNQCPTIHDLINLKYTENVIKETLRLYPAVPMIGRTLLEEVKLPSGYTLPANSHLNIFIYGMHRNPKVFPEPEKFIPERFNSNNENNRHPFSYIPFSAGPRNCIGQKLAILELKLVLYTLLKNYKLLPADKTKSITLKMEIVLRAKEGIPVRLIKRV